MGSDDEISEDEHEILVYVEFEGLVDVNVFSEEQLQLDMIGIDTEHPIMQINGKLYEGTYEDVNGTYMFFVKNDNFMPDDPVFDDIPSLTYFTKTKKILKMQRIFIKSRTEVLGDSTHDRCIPNLKTLRLAGVPCRYQEEALSFWKTMRTNRLNALHSYLEKQKIRREKKSQGIIPESESDEDNPFAMYKHKDESDNTNKFNDTSVKREEDPFYSKSVSPKEIIDESLNTVKDSCDGDLQEFRALQKPQSLTSDDANHRLNTCINNLSKKRSTNKAHKKQRIKDKKAQPSITKSKRSFDKIEEKLEELHILNVNGTSSTSDTLKNTNINDDCEPTKTEECEAKVDQEDATNAKISKQLKREAKMKEISEQLRAYAEEYKY
nr:uncharacterized protein LOC116432025 [Nomia melanderi]